MGATRPSRLALAAAATLAAALLLATPALATDFPVANTSDLVAALNPTTGAQDNDTITFTGDITLTQDLPAVQNNVTIVGANHSLSGNNQFRGLFVGAWTAGTATQVPVTVAIQDLTILNAKAQGGAAGGRAGGGAGLGGALFVANLASLALNDVDLTSNNATGGTGGGQFISGGAGGGMGGPAGFGSFGGGGGLGSAANGFGGSFTAAGPGIAVGAASGGGGGAGGADGGGGGSGDGGGVGGGAGPGGAGGFGGGGGSAQGVGGFGGGGGGGGAGGGAGGFGGGGGGAQSGAGGSGGFGAGDGGSANGLGGAGAGMGGGIFVQQGGSLSIAGPVTVNGNTVNPGTGGNGGAQAFGSGIFVQGNDANSGGAGSLTFSPASGETQTVSNAIADQTGSGGTSGNAGAWGLTKSGAGTLVLSGTNTYSGLTTVNAGTLAVNGSLSSTGQGVLVSAAGTLGGNGTIGDVGVVGTLAPGNSVGTLHTGALQMSALSPHYAVEIDSGGADQTDVTGTVDLSSGLGGATLDLSLLGGFTPTAGTRYTIIQNDGSDPVSGTFSGLPDGSTFTAGGSMFRISYVAGDGNDVRLTSIASPTLSTDASAGVAAGSGLIDDTGTLAGGANPTRTITFRLFGPKDQTCAGAPRFNDRVTVSGNGDYLSGGFTPNRAGTYHWTASYSGDGSNEAASTACGDPNESVSVAKASPTISTTASADVPLGGQVHDTATLSGGSNPTGTMTFRLYGRGDATCSNAPIYKNRVMVAGNGGYASGNFTPARPGTYRWTASYSGDSSNNPAPTACNDPNESVTVG